MRKLVTMWAVSVFVASTVSGGEIKKTVHFSPSSLTISKLEGYDFVRLEGCGSTEEVGAPSLPRVSFSLLIPPGGRSC